MKYIRSLEKRLFPNDSVYQRMRRRRMFVFGLVCSVLLVWGVAWIVNSVNGRGRPIDRAQQPGPLPSLNLK
jgi:hypothetical protein